MYKAVTYVRLTGRAYICYSVKTKAVVKHKVISAVFLFFYERACISPVA